MRTPHPPLTAYYPKEADRSGLRAPVIRSHGRGLRSRRARHGIRQRLLVSAPRVATGGAEARECGFWTSEPAPDSPPGRPSASSEPSGEVTGVDPSTGMMERAKVPHGLLLVGGTAEAIPAPAGAADFVSMGYALRHIADLSAAFREFLRVLVPGGRLCLLEITSPDGRPSRWLLKAYMRTRGSASWRAAGRAPRHAGTHALLLGHDRGVRRCEPDNRGAARGRIRRGVPPRGARRSFPSTAHASREARAADARWRSRREPAGAAR